MALNHKLQLLADTGQAEVAAFLSSPAAYPAPPAEVERVQTHAAMVFLSGDDAYKIKRAVTYSYLDFSTLEKRRRTLEHEYEVNRANAPGIYRGVTPIVRSQDGKLAIGGNGQVVEWALHMRRFATPSILSNRFATNPPSDRDVRDLAEAVVKLHQGATPKKTPDGAIRIGAIVEELREAFAEHSDRLPDEAVERFIDLAHLELDRVRLCLKFRGRRGCIRRCHGDLHLGNIVEIDNTPVLFDAIEFDDELATIDVLYDLAFLLMDLDLRGYRRAANLLLNRYLKLSLNPLDLYGLAALPLFLGLRAAIRAMVALQRGHGSDSHAEAEAWRYLDQALGYLQPSDPRLIAVGGCSGTGKSTLALGLAPLVGRAPGGMHLSSDTERKDLAGVAEQQRLGAAGYTLEVTVAVYRRLQSKASRILRSGSCVVVDATFLRAEDRMAIEAIGKRLGVPFTGIWLTASQPVASARVALRQADVSDATPDIVERQFSDGTPPNDWIAIDASGTPEQTLSAAKLRIVTQGNGTQYGQHSYPLPSPDLQSDDGPLFCNRWQQNRSFPCSPTTPPQPH
jgi:uncharacterized protein